MKKYSLFLSVAAILLLLGLRAEAQGILTDLANQYQAASAGWMSRSLVYARQMFFLLMTIEIAVFSCYELFRKDGLAEFISSLFLKLLGLLFAYTLLVEAPTWLPTIIASFTQAGAAIGGTATLDPSSVVNQGIDLARAMTQIDASLFTAPLVIATAILTALGTVIAYVCIAAELLLVLVESYIIIGGGVLLLGFLGSRHTEHLGMQFLTGIVRVGVRLFVLYLVIGLGVSLQGQLLAELTASAQLQGLPDIRVYFGVLAGSAVFALMVWRIPDLALSMLSGSAAMGLGSSAGTALMGASIARAVSVGVVQGMRSDRTASKPSEGSAAMREAAKYGQGERHSYGSGAAGTEARRRDLGLPDVQPYKGGLNTVTPQTPSGAGGTATRKSDFDFPNVQPHQGGLNTISPNPPPAPAPAPAGQRP